MTTHQEIIVDQFTRQAVHYACSPGHNDDDALQLILQASGVSAHDMVLDVACGSGIVARAFAPRAAQVTGIDLTPAMLEHAATLARAQELHNLAWQHGDSEALPFPDASFSLVVSRYAFHHFLRPGIVLAEMARVCAPGGRVVVIDAFPAPEIAEAFNHFEKLLDPSHACALTLDEFRDHAALAGLHKMELTFFRMEMSLEHDLAASFPLPGDADKVRRLFQEDIGVNRLGVDAHLRNGEIYFAYPITIAVAERRPSPACTAYISEVPVN